MGACVVTVECAANAPIFQSSTAISTRMNCRVARSQTSNSTFAPGPSCPSPVPWCRSLSAKLSLLLFPDEKVLLVHFSRHRDVEKAYHHLVVGLFAPAHLGIRIRIVRVGLRIVVPRDGLKFRSSTQEPRLRQPVAHLPMEVIVDAEQGFDCILRLAIGAHFLANQVVFESLSTQVHVRKKTEQRGVTRERAACLHAVVRRARRYGEVVVGEL